MIVVMFGLKVFFPEIAAWSLERTMFVISEITIHYMRQFRSFVSSYF
jgi:hypothetical protein